MDARSEQPARRTAVRGALRAGRIVLNDALAHAVGSTREVFRRIAGDGWLVLAGKPPTLGREAPRLAEELLQHVDLSEPCHVLAPRSALLGPESFLPDLEELLEAEVGVHIAEDIRPTLDFGRGLIILLDGEVQPWLTALQHQGLDERLISSLGEGAVLYASGTAAACLGSWVFSDSESEPSPGLRWLPGAVVLPGEGDPLEGQGVQSLLRGQERSYVLGLPASAILAFGPQGEIEVWGEASPRIGLGRGWA